MFSYCFVFYLFFHFLLYFVCLILNRKPDGKKLNQQNLGKVRWLNMMTFNSKYNKKTASRHSFGVSFVDPEHIFIVFIVTLYFSENPFTIFTKSSIIAQSLFFAG